MIKKCFVKTNRSFLTILSIVALLTSSHIPAQVEGSIPQEIRWLQVNSIKHWFSNGGAEIEYGRRGRAGFVGTDQLDGLGWPQDNVDQDVNVGKSLWIGTTDFDDPTNGLTYAHKVVSAGRGNLYLGSEIYPESISLVAQSEHPVVLVDDLKASKIDVNDVPDEIDPSIPADRIIENTLHTAIGVTVNRRILAFTQQNHDNYFIYEYEFTNTGIIDESGEQKLNKTLTDVIFHLQYRYGFAGESYHEGWAPTGAAWGLNTINDVSRLDNGGEFRALWSYYGPISTSPGIQDDIGLPHHTEGGILAGTNFAGVVVLHADTSPTDPTDDITQPTSTKFQGSDRGAQGVNQYSEALMTRKYTEFMNGGHDNQTHADQIGKDANGWPTGFANNWSGDAGGIAIGQGFGPYNLEIGQSIKIVVAEAIAGIMKNRENVRAIADNWFNETGDYVLPDGSTTNDKNVYKNTWVFSGKDSLFQSFRRAIANYNSGYSIPAPPPAPSWFEVNSGGDKIALEWDSNAESWPNFDGYSLYRSEGRIDTTYDLIFECDASSVVNSYEDKTPVRGLEYYYYIQTKDDGSTNDYNPGVPLVSSKFYTNSNEGAFLTRPPGAKLSEIRIVPNPYNISTRDPDWPDDQIAFYGIPGACIIRIFTETGTLIETIEHTNGSSDELWRSLTSSGQIVVSGVYIAHFEVTEDLFQDTDEDGIEELVFKKGESTIEKFIIIR